MIVTVRRNSRYSEVIVSDGGASINPGLLDEDEARGVAEQFMDAAEELRPYSKWTKNELEGLLDEVGRALADIEEGAE